MVIFIVGDVLVYVNTTCVLGYTHQDVVNMFQSIPVGDKVTLEICRGYALPFDPNDPNTEIVTTVAVTLPEGSTSVTNTSSYSSSSFANHSRDSDNMMSQRNNKSMPDLTNTHNDRLPMTQRNKSFDELNHDSPLDSRAEIISVDITKGAMGFGFTITDSAYGQRVKQILDKDRCQNMAEGDLLLEINQFQVKDMPHSDVVQILKECPKGAMATMVVQRGGQFIVQFSSWLFQGKSITV